MSDKQPIVWRSKEWASDRVSLICDRDCGCERCGALCDKCEAIMKLEKAIGLDFEGLLAEAFETGATEYQA